MSQVSEASQAQIPALQSEIEELRTLSLAELLHKDVWARLHPATKIIIKALQHIRSKLNDMAEVRMIANDSSICITTHRSRIIINENGIEFVRYNGDEIRVQRARVKLPKDVIEAVREQIRLMLEHDAEPNYGLIAYTIQLFFEH